MRPSTKYTIRNVLFFWAGVLALLSFSLLPGVQHRVWFDWHDSIKFMAWLAVVGGTGVIIGLTQDDRKRLDEGWKPKKDRAFDAIAQDADTKKHDFSSYRK